MSATSNSAIKRADAVALWIFIAAGVTIAIAATWSAVARIIDVLPNRDVSVLAQFSGTSAEAPIGVNGAPETVELDMAFVTAPSLPAASVWAVVIQQVILAAVIICVVACLAWLAHNVSRGRVFSRTNTVLVSTAGLTGLAGLFAVPFFGNMAANGAFAVVSDRTFDNVILSVDLFPLVLAAFVVGLMSTVFAVGERLQRDTEGLV